MQRKGSSLYGLWRHRGEDSCRGLECTLWEWEPKEVILDPMANIVEAARGLGWAHDDLEAFTEQQVTHPRALEVMLALAPQIKGWLETQAEQMNAVLVRAALLAPMALAARGLAELSAEPIAEDGSALPAEEAAAQRALSAERARYLFRLARAHGLSAPRQAAMDDSAMRQHIFKNLRVVMEYNSGFPYVSPGSTRVVGVMTAFYLAECRTTEGLVQGPGMVHTTAGLPLYVYAPEYPITVYGSLKYAYYWFYWGKPLYV